MTREQQTQDPLPYRVLANPRRLRASSAHRDRQPVADAADRSEPRAQGGSAGSV